MIGISKLLCDASFAHDPLRYGRHARADVKDPHRMPPSAARRKPVVVWNMTRTCNLHCVHCYTDSAAEKYSGELPFERRRRCFRTWPPMGCRPC